VATGGGGVVDLVELAGFFVAFGFVEEAERAGAGFCLVETEVFEAVVFLGVLDLPDDDFVLVFLDDFVGVDLSAMVNVEDYSTYRLTICGTILFEQRALN
jgi:hypothetical protein